MGPYANDCLALGPKDQLGHTFVLLRDLINYGFFWDFQVKHGLEAIRSINSWKLSSKLAQTMLSVDTIHAAKLRILNFQLRVQVGG